MNDIEKEYYNQNDFWEKHWGNIEEVRVKEITKMIPSRAKSLLDVGCGSGALINSLNLKRVVGVDIAEQALKYVKKEKALASAESLPFREKTFDIVTCSEVLEHLEDSVFLKAVKEIERVAKDYILITVPNQENLKRSSVFCPSCKRMFHPYFHVRSFDKKKLANVFNKFKLLEIKESGPSQPYVPDFLVKVLRKVEKPSPLGTSICPFCGYKGRDVEDNPGIISLVKSKARVFFPKKKRWLFALYKCAE